MVFTYRNHSFPDVRWITSSSGLPVLSHLPIWHCNISVCSPISPDSLGTPRKQGLFHSLPWGSAHGLWEKDLNEQTTSPMSLFIIVICPLNSVTSTRVVCASFAGNTGLLHPFLLLSQLPGSQRPDFWCVFAGPDPKLHETIKKTYPHSEWNAIKIFLSWVISKSKASFDFKRILNS